MRAPNRTARPPERSRDRPGPPAAAPAPAILMVSARTSAEVSLRLRRVFVTFDPRQPFFTSFQEPNNDGFHTHGSSLCA